MINTKIDLDTIVLSNGRDRCVVRRSAADEASEEHGGLSRRPALFMEDDGRLMAFRADWRAEHEAQR